MDNMYLCAVEECEYFLDLRKLLKLSVSLILVYAVEKFLDKLLKKNSTDNNRFRNYVFIKDVIDDIICWKFIWVIMYPAHSLI